MSLRSVSINSLAAVFLLLCTGTYFSQGALYSQGSILSQGALLAIYSLSAFYCVKTLALKDPPIAIWIWLALLMLNVVGYLMTLNFSRPLYVGQLKALLLFFLPLYPAYYLARKRFLTEKKLLVFFVVMLLITMLNFQFSKSVILAARLSGREDVVNNAAYSFVVLLPYVFLFKRKIYSTISLLFILLFVIEGAKRGAILVAGLGAVVYGYYALRHIENRYKTIGYILAAITSLAIASFLYSYFLNNEFLMQRMAMISEGGSGRDRIFKNLFLAWLNSDNVVNYLFGFGFASTVEHSGTGHAAHNDWLELLTNFGLLGVLLYSLMFFMIHRVIKKLKNKRHQFMLRSIVLMWALTTLFSMVYTSYPSIFYSIALGYLLAQTHIEKVNYASENTKT